MVVSKLYPLSRLINRLCRGVPGETLSARAYREVYIKPLSGGTFYTPQRARWAVVMRTINKMFKDPSHCRDAYVWCVVYRVYK